MSHARCSEKAQLREKYRKIRLSLSESRRKEAARDCYHNLISHIPRSAKVLSFASKAEELDLWPLNDELLLQGRLYLPKVYVDHFSVYSVASKDTLIRSTYSILEPDPLCSPKAELAEMDIILVPGLCFDQHRHRIGYGKGHYDRMLHLLRETEHKAKIWGVGFKEQLLDEPFRAEPHDQPLDHVLLF